MVIAYAVIASRYNSTSVVKELTYLIECVVFFTHLEQYFSGFVFIAVA
jgi:hypothetical protein